MATGNDNCCDCNCSCACTSNFLMKCWLVIIMTGPILVMFVLIFVMAIVSNIFFVLYYAIAGWMCESSCCCGCCYCENCFSDSMKGPWKPLRFFWGRIYAIFHEPLVQDEDVRIYSNQRNI